MTTNLLLQKHMKNVCNTASKKFENFDKNEEIFILRASKKSFWGLYNAVFQILSSNMGVLWQIWEKIH